jgi:hypothetical protein
MAFEVTTPVFDGANDWENANPQACLTFANGDDYVVSGSVIIRRGLRGRMWGRSYFALTMFSTVLPPNSPSCSMGTVLTTDNSRSYFSSSSYHTGGVNVALSDAAVRFISNSIDTGTLSKPALTNAASPYGVWGAMGTMNGGENQSF